jgi:HSP20 family protein
MYDKKFNERIKKFFNDDFFVSSFTFNPNDLKQKVNDVIKNNVENRDYSHNLPVTNIFEDGWSFRYELLTPGFTKKDISVELNNGYLSVSGERNKEDGKGDGEYISKEYHSTKFERTYSLPDNIVQDEVYAMIENGITTIFLPKEKPTKVNNLKRKVTVE